MDSTELVRLKNFLRSAICSFVPWRSPIDALVELKSIKLSIGREFPSQKGAFLSHRDAKSLREMWVLAECALAMGISKIKLSQTQKFDGFVCCAGKAVPAEVVEIIEPGRKRSLEFGPDAPRLRMDPGENWVSRANAIPEALTREIAKKKRKSYPDQTELFVYLNISEYGIRQRKIEVYIRSELSKEPAPFSAIHVKWKEKVFSSSGSTFGPDNSLDYEFDESDDN